DLRIRKVSRVRQRSLPARASWSRAGARWKPRCRAKDSATIGRLFSLRSGLLCRSGLSWTRRQEPGDGLVREIFRQTPARHEHDPFRSVAQTTPRRSPLRSVGRENSAGARTGVVENQVTQPLQAFTAENGYR